MGRPEQTFAPLGELDVQQSITDCWQAKTWRPMAVGLLVSGKSVVLRREASGYLALPTEEILNAGMPPEHLFLEGTKFKGLIKAAKYAGLVGYTLLDEGVDNQFPNGIVSYLVKGTLRDVPQRGTVGHYRYMPTEVDAVMGVLMENFEELAHPRTGLAIAAIDAYRTSLIGQAVTPPTPAV